MPGNTGVVVEVTQDLGQETYTIAGRTVTMPCVVRDAFSVVSTYLVASAPARHLLPGPDIDIAEVLPGKGLLTLACIDYRDNDLGGYNEVAISLFVRKRGDRSAPPYLGTAIDYLRSRLPTCIIHLPVNQGFTCEAGCRIWGFPKTVEQIDFSDDHNRCRLVMGGQHVLTFETAAGGSGKTRIPDTPMETYSYIDGRPHRNPFVSGADGVTLRLGGSSVELGSHPIATQLRSLGLPRRPLMTVRMERMHGRFEAPQPLL
ncbi:MAG: acetoacetate decarboxylase family protein [Deltaproteobacteria bacterium]|jgi:hypothetical protein